MLQILQARFQQYVNHEPPDVQAGFRKGRGTGDQTAKHPLDHQKSNKVPGKYLLLLYWLCQSLDCVHHNKLWKILQKMGIPGHLTCLRNLYAGQKATVRTAHGTTVDSKLGKEDIYSQGCILSPCLFNLNAKYIMWNAILEEAQAGIKTAMEI